MMTCYWLSCHLGPCIYLGASLQQQAHHVAVPSFGRDVQRRDVVLRERTGASTRQRPTQRRSWLLLAYHVGHMMNYNSTVWQKWSCRTFSDLIWLQRKTDKHPPLEEQNHPDTFSCKLFWFNCIFYTILICWQSDMSSAHYTFITSSVCLCYNEVLEICRNLLLQMQENRKHVQAKNNNSNWSWIKTQS